MSEPKLSAGLVWTVVKDAVGEWMNANAMRLSAALSYYSVFSIAPLLLIAIGIAGWFYGGPAAASGKIELHLTGLIGWEAARAVQALVKSAGENGGGGATLIGFVVLLVGASTVFAQLKDSLNTIWEVQPKAGLGVMGFIKDRLMSFGMVLVIGFLLLVSLLVAAVVAGLGGWLETTFGIPKALTGIAGFVVPFAIEAVLFALLFKVLPDAIIEWRSVWVGGAITAVLFEIGKWGLSFYLAKTAPQSSFGAMGSLVIILLWVYYASMILFFGAAVTEVYARKMGHSIQPAPNAESTELTCPGGAKPQPVSRGSAAAAQAGDVPAEPALTKDGDAPRAPAHETLTPLIARTLQPDPEVARRAAEEAALARMPGGKFRVWVKQANDHPIVEIVAALTVGVVAGTIQRMREKEELSPSEHFRLGARELGERSQHWAARLVERVQTKVGSLKV